MSEVALALVEPAPPPSPSAPPWSQPARIGFRFLVSYFALYHFALVDNSEWDYKWLTLKPLWTRVVPWLGHHVLHIARDIATEGNGSGDKLYDWLLAGTFACIAIVATIVWSIVDRRRARYDRLAALFHVFIRFHVAVQMITYGLAKAIPSQFPPPGSARLLETFGEASPMGILWAFMGASTAYTVFAGLGELAGGILVVFRRTATLGALVSAGVMTNVVMLNFCYDVPVKLFSSHLLLMTLIVAAPDARRLVDVLVFHRATTARDWRWQPRARWARIAVPVVKLGLLALVMWSIGHESYKYWHDWNTHSATWGIYDIEKQDGTSYRNAFMQNSWGALRTDAGVFVSFKLPAKDGSVEATLRDKKQTGTLKLSVPDADHVRLDGTVGAEKVAVTLKRRTSPVPLQSRGFHFINEFPFNR